MSFLESVPSEQQIAVWRERVRACLNEAISASQLPDPLKEAIRYGSTIPVASRWRAILVMQVGETLGSNPEACLLAASAVEALHCATLSLDDLPCMDDALERRGRPALHQKFNEAVAIQAALWLLGISRTLVVKAAKLALGDTSPAQQAAAVSFLSELQQRTEDELQLGQFMDMKGSLGRLKVDAVEVAKLKCARTFALSAQLAAWLSTTPADKRGRTAVLDSYGEAIGLAYQALDDLDEHPTDAVAASWSGPGEVGKPTYIAQFGKEDTERLVAEYLERAAAALGPLAAEGTDCKPLEHLASLILRRAAVK